MPEEMSLNEGQYWGWVVTKQDDEFPEIFFI